MAMTATIEDKEISQEELSSLLEVMRECGKRLEDIGFTVAYSNSPAEVTMTSGPKQPVEIKYLKKFLQLPDHLRRTYITLERLVEATADDVAEQTKNCRAVESGYLNQLVNRNYLVKERKGRKAYFSINEEEIPLQWLHNFIECIL